MDRAGGGSRCACRRTRRAPPPSTHQRNPDRSGADVFNSEVILTNIRVLAIDQAPKEKDGANALVGKTVTLELKPEQAETLARSRQSGTLSLALRSITDVNMVESGADEQALKRSSSSISKTTLSWASRLRC